LIKALIKRRFWLWKNRLLSSISLVFLLPVIFSLLVVLPLKNIILYSLSGVLYEIWVYPGLIYFITSIGLFPLLYRDFFDLRIHNKLLINISLTPYSKSNIIFSYLSCSIIESIIFGILAASIYSLFIPENFEFFQYLFFLILLILHLFLLGNLFISFCLIINSITIMWITTFCFFIFILFGNSFIIQLEFFPPILEIILKYQPFSFSYQVLNRFLSIDIIDWKLIAINLFLIYIWIIFNGYILKKKFQQ
tara:strand:+ start:30 stop:779 length:750 start_codon:yes stop_codon:yes gene_type:complete